MQEIEITDSSKFPKSFQSCLGNWNNKTNLVKQLFSKWRGTLPKVLNSFQTNHLANLDSTAYLVTSQRSERIDFYCNHKEADSNIFAYIKFFCDSICLNTIIVSPDCDGALIYLYQRGINSTFLNALWFKTGTGDDIYTH